MADVGQLFEGISLLPNFSGAPDIQSVINILMWIVIISAGSIILIRHMQHRILVEILEQVKGGYVATASRYAIAYDKKNQLEYLRPIWGSARLPSFPLECFQKTKGAPFIGIQREISIIRINKYSYKVSLPTQDTTSKGVAAYYDSLSWMFLEQRRMFLKEQERGKFMAIMSMLAPSFVIIAMGIILGFAIYTQVNMEHNYANFLIENLKIVKEAYGK